MLQRMIKTPPTRKLTTAIQEINYQEKFRSNIKIALPYKQWPDFPEPYILPTDAPRIANAVPHQKCAKFRMDYPMHDRQHHRYLIQIN
jgi:hypothetical protein